METPQYNANQLSDRTSEISPNGGLQRWFVGLFALIVLLIGLLISSRNGDNSLYQLGLVIAACGLATIIYTISTGFSRKH